MKIFLFQRSDLKLQKEKLQSLNVKIYFTRVHEIYSNRFIEEKETRIF